MPDPRTSLLALALSIACAVGASMAFAQDDQGEPDDPPAPVPIPFKNQIDLYYPSIAPPATRAELMVQLAQKQIEQLEEALEEARTQRDILRMNCLTRALREARRWLKKLKASATALKAAEAQNDPIASGRALDSATEASDKIDRIASDARECIGNDFVFQPKGDPDDDDSDNTPFPGDTDTDAGTGTDTDASTPIGFERPTYASPFGADP